METNLNLTIIDDNIAEVSYLKSRCNEIPGIQADNCFTNAIMGLNYLLHGPDKQIVLLDIEMSGLSGLQVAEKVIHRNHYIIFTTAHPRYALEAFSVHANNYLCKPIELEDISLALDRAKANLASKTVTAETDEYLYLKVTDSKVPERYRVSIKDIISIKGANNNVEIQTTKLKFKAYYTLKEMMICLSRFPQFIQTHKSYIVNANSITSIQGHTLRMGQFTALIGDCYQTEIMDMIDSCTFRTTRI
ncbi:LytTR family DNA-binding domain-containing protein [Pedobacter sp. BMA]|uniref:LytR/AlgR family response regulator transcription factor n=1 Tax=Pedobacter sp. BMA TaxID=1663685 RepID=UPI00064932E8|nr:LytTR family DNA-binding domain-containing protein [Pedobacter sp. BMA]KLT63907.1 hypothetical protein AB669_19445 [Pedobacter sp. BMA]